MTDCIGPVPYFVTDTATMYTVIQDDFVVVKIRFEPVYQCEIASFLDNILWIVVFIKMLF